MRPPGILFHPLDLDQKGGSDVLGINTRLFYVLPVRERGRRGLRSSGTMGTFEG